jgi:hypothetical protein
LDNRGQYRARLDRIAEHGDDVEAHADLERPAASLMIPG